MLYSHYKHWSVIKSYSMWVMEYEENDYAAKHSHYPAKWSGVYYVKCDDDCSPLILADQIMIKPVDGLYVLFPGDAVHRLTYQVLSQSSECLQTRRNQMIELPPELYPPSNYSYEVTQHNKGAIWIINHQEFTYTDTPPRSIWGFYNLKQRVFHAPINAKTVGKEVTETTPYSAMQLNRNPLQQFLYA